MEACEKCDAIIPGKAIRAGTAHKTASGYLCEECAGAAVAAPPPPPPPAEEEVVEGIVIEEEPPAPAPAARPEPRPAPAGGRRRPTRRVPAASRARPARAAPPRRSPRAAAPRGRPPGAKRPHPIHPKKEGLDMITKVGLAVAGVLILGAGSAYTVVQLKEAAKERARKAAIARSAGAVSWLNDLLEQAESAETEEWWVDAEAKIAEHREELIAGSQDESRYSTNEGRFRTMRDRFNYEQQSRADLAQAKDRIQGCDTILDGVTLLEKLDSTGGLMGDSFREEVGSLLRESREKAAACKMEEATNYRRLNPGDYKGILQRVLEARDVLIELHENQPNTPEGKEKRAQISEQIKETIAVEDEVAGEWYASGYEDQVEWRNLLVPSEFPKDAEDKTANWGGKGVEFHLEDGTLILKGMPGGRAATLGVVGVGARERWIDYDLDLEVKVVAAGFDLLARLHPTLPYVQFGLRVMPGETLIEEGKTYQIVQKVHSGDQWLYIDGEELEHSKLGKEVRHPGGVGFALERDAHIEITRMRVKVLR